LHVIELAVAQTFQRRGLGRRLLDAARGWAEDKDLSALTLTTFRHVAWNAPFYARYGFSEVSGATIGARLKEIVRKEEVELGLPNRCAMRMML
jgi:GNAT superfamily N-acetyltransferase